MKTYAQQLDEELLALRSQLILEMTLQITLAVFIHSVGEQVQYYVFMYSICMLLYLFCFSSTVDPLVFGI